MKTLGGGGEKGKIKVFEDGLGGVNYEIVGRVSMVHFRDRWR